MRLLRNINIFIIRLLLLATNSHSYYFSIQQFFSGCMCYTIPIVDILSVNKDLVSAQLRCSLAINDLP